MKYCKAEIGIAFNITNSNANQLFIAENGTACNIIDSNANQLLPSSQ
jgi:hypothetical protein